MVESADWVKAEGAQSGEYRGDSTGQHEDQYYR
jgi:hypothetical protein